MNVSLVNLSTLINFRPFYLRRNFSISLSLCKQKPKSMIPNNKLFIRCLQDSETFQAIFHCCYEKFNIEREFNFNRRLAEPVDDFIKRIRVNLDKTITSKTKKLKKKATPENPVKIPEIEILVNVGKDLFETQKSCSELFFDKNKDISFTILGVKYNVVINSPWVDVLSLPNTIMSDFPVYPNKYEAVFSNLTDSKFKWFSSESGKDDWIEAGDNFIFAPPKEIENCYLKLICIPSDGTSVGPERECVSGCQVSSGPGKCPFEERHKFTSDKLDDSGLRVVSYNILADVYAETVEAKTILFPYCPQHAMTLDYRKQLYLKEILGYNADILCLQEVDEKVFNYDLKHVLGLQGLEGVFSDKGGTIREGVSTFFNSHKFRLLDNVRIFLAEEVTENSVFKSLWSSISPNSAAAKSLVERSTVLQVTVLERLTDKRDKLIVGNTHLYFHPEADHIRLAQTGLCMEYIKYLITDLKYKNPEDRYSLVFCGDLNSSPDCGAYQLMTTGHVAADFKDWKSNKAEPIEGVELRHPFPLESAYGKPLYTNYTAGFKDCLDWIYYQTDCLQLAQAVPLPKDKVLKRHTALPSVVFPSDHLALIADFTWK